MWEERRSPISAPPNNAAYRDSPSMGKRGANITIGAAPNRARSGDGRCTPESDRLLRCREMTRWANTRRKQVQQLTRLFAITSSAVESKLFGTVRPGTLAVLRLSTSSNLVGRRLAARGRR